jgi:hypothetical protein
MRRVLLLGLLACFACVACSTSTSSDPPTKELKHTSTLGLHQLTGSYGAFDDGQHIEIFVAILGDGFMLLGDGDAVTVDVNGTTVPLTERIEDTKVHYVGEFPSPPVEPVVTVTFTRRDEKSVATVRIAPAFEPKTPPTTAKIGDKLDLDLDPRPDLTKWQGVLGPMIQHAVELTGDCIDQGDQKIKLGQTYPLSWDTSTIQLVAGSTGCEVDVSFRLETGAPPFDGAFGGGFDGLQFRHFKLALTK